MPKNVFTFYISFTEACYIGLGIDSSCEVTGINRVVITGLPSTTQLNIYNRYGDGTAIPSNKIGMFAFVIGV